MESGAGGADGRAAVSAADQQPFVRFVRGVVAVQDLAGQAVTGGGCALEVDRVSTATGSGDLCDPAAEVRVLDEADQVLVDF